MRKLLSFPVPFIKKRKEVTIMKKLSKTFILMLILAFVFSNVITSFADSDVSAATAIIGESTSSQLSTDSATSNTTSSVKPKAVITVEAIAIGSGLVDLDTRVKTNVNISTISGVHGERTSTGIATSWDLYRTSIGTKFANFSDQTSWNPGTIINYVWAEGTISFYTTYSVNFSTVPNNADTVVY